jgi:hypothetical protein
VGAFDIGTPDGLLAWSWTIRDDSFVEFDGEVDAYLDAQVDILDLGEGVIGTWSLTLRYSDPNRALLETPGYGVVIRPRGLEVVAASGRVQLPQTQIAEDGQTVTYTGSLDEWELKSDIAAPDPTTDYTLGGNVDATVKDTRTGAAETVLLGFIKDNIGSTAYHGGIDRRRPYLSVPASSGRGSSGTWQGEFTPLDELATSLVATSGISVRITQRNDADGLEVVIRARADVSDEVIFSQADATIDQAQYGTKAPTATFAISVDSDDTTRTVAYAFDATAETRWAMRAVVMTSSGGADGTPAQAAAAALADGAETFQADIEPVVLPGGPQPFVDYFVGDTVGVVKLDGTVVLERLTGLSYTHSGGDNQRPPIVTPVVGALPIVRHDPTAALVVKTIAPVIRKLKRKKG